MEAAEVDSPKRWYRVAAWTVGASLVLIALAATFWPTLLEGVAEEKVVAALERKFDVVEVGGLELARDHLHIRKLHLEKESVTVDIDVIDVSFEVDWGFSPQVLVSQVVARGGRVVGELEDIKELRSSPSRTSAGAGSSRLQLEEAELELEDLQLEVARAGLLIKTTASASAPSPAGPVALEFVALELLEEGQRIGSASTVRIQLELEHIFPLELELTGGQAGYEDLLVTGVEGTVTVGDEVLEQVSLDLHGQTEEGQSWSLEGDLDRKQDLIDITLAAEDIRPSQFPGAARLPLAPENGRVSGSISLKGSRKAVFIEGEVVLEDVRVEYPKLALQQVVVNQRLALAGQVDLEERVLEVKRASISPLEKKAWELVISGRAHHAVDPDQRQYELEVELESAPCQELLEAAPPGLLPALEGFELEGTTSVDMRVLVVMNDPDSSVLEGGLDIDACRIKKVPPTVAGMTGAFNHVIKMKNGQTVQRLLGRGGVYYTPMDRMPGSLPAAVTSTEDGGFWRHDGFIKSQFQASLRRNVELGQFRRGASTITMQMVKNVLLNQEKTVARKLQELFLTWVIEKKLSKERIMEIYLNAVEFGPGIYGVGDAADHYFGKVPYELTSLESAFLATLLPRPVERHEMWCRGEVPPKHLKYVHMVHRRMLATHRITQAEFDVAEATPLVFSRRGWAGEAACLSAGRRVAEGTHTQGALSGLLLGRPELPGGSP